MKRFLLGLMLMLSLSVMPVMAQEEDDRTWIESLPPNQDSIETPWFIRDTTGSTLAERLKDDEKKRANAGIAGNTLSGSRFCNRILFSEKE